MSDELKNASQLPRMFYCRHMQPGTCGYENGVVLVDTDALKKMIATGVGLPVYIDHDTNSPDVRLKRLKEDAAGFITESFYNELDGWAWFKYIAIDDEAHAAIAKGMAVSNAYTVSQWGMAGTKNNVPYLREVLDGEFTHLAIVKNPRYEGAQNFTPEEFKAYQENKKRELEELHNSKPTKGSTMFKLFKNVKQEVSAIDAETMVELENGATVSVAEMINAVKKNSDEEEKEKKKEELDNADPEVDVGGEKMKLSDLKNCYLKMNEKKNADEEAKKKAEEEEKKNAEEAEKKKKAEEETEEKKNAKFFEELANANLKAESQPKVIETGANKVQRGNDRYGSKKSN